MNRTMPPSSSGGARKASPVWAAVVGVVSATLTLAVAEVLSLLLGGIGNPILAVGSLVIDVVPPAFKTLIIALFDTADKFVLFMCLAVVVLVFAVAVGILQVRKSPWGSVLLAAVAVVAIFAAVTRADATLAAALPTLGGAIAGILVLRVLTNRLVEWNAAPFRGAELGGGDTDVGRQYERRSFLRLTVAVGVTSATVGAGARWVSAAAAVVSDLRSGIRLPSAVSGAPALAADATLDVPGITPYITPNDEFYRIDTALQVPSVDPREWVLRVTGMVEEEIEISFDELLALPLIERVITLACVSNEVGGDLIGNAVWLGYPIRDLLARARPMAGADMVLSTSTDGFTASTPLDVLQDVKTDALLAVGMNGEPLPLEHGFPVRMVVPGLYGYVSATKWVVELEVTRFADKMAYWTPRGWTERGPIKLSSRIDTPRGTASSGRVTVAGVAWAQHTGIGRVQVRVDGGAWNDATLATTATVDAWLQWSYGWDATSGSHELTVRATDSDGLVQTEAEAPPAPDGSSGLHGITLQVA